MKITRSRYLLVPTDEDKYLCASEFQTVLMPAGTHYITKENDVSHFQSRIVAGHETSVTPAC
jgi:hypothetical protein